MIYLAAVVAYVIGSFALAVVIGRFFAAGNSTTTPDLSLFTGGGEDSAGSASRAVGGFVLPVGGEAHQDRSGDRNAHQSRGTSPVGSNQFHNGSDSL